MSRGNKGEALNLCESALKELLVQAVDQGDFLHMYKVYAQMYAVSQGQSIQGARPSWIGVSMRLMLVRGGGDV